jgi:hypothetical protein
VEVGLIYIQPVYFYTQKEKKSKEKMEKKKIGKK